MRITAKLIKGMNLKNRFWARGKERKERVKRSEIAEEAARRGKSCQSTRARATFRM